MDKFNRFSANRFVRFGHCAALFVGAFLLGVGLVAHADDLQDANKLFKQGQHSQAMDKISSYLAGKPKDAQGRFLKGLILTEQGKPPEAIKIFTALTEDYPELPEPYNNLAVLYASQGQYDKAKQSLEMAIRTHPSYATAHENLGDIYAKMASQAYDRALQLDRSNTATQTKLAMIQDLFAGGARGKSSATSNTPPPASTATAKAAPAKVEAAKQEPVKAAPAKPEIAKAEPVKPVKPEPAKTEPVKPVKPEPTKTEPVIAAKPEPTKIDMAKQETAKPAAPGSAVKPPASTDKPANVAAPSAAGSKDEVLKTVKDWAAAWSSKNVAGYLSFYASDFRPQEGMDRAAWEAQRKERISKPASIHIGISDANVSFTDTTHATVQFRQSYRADKVKIPGRKTLRMVNSAGKWLIQEEHAK